MVHFWNVNAVADELKNNHLSERKQFHYFCFSFAVAGKITLFLAYVSNYSYLQGFTDFVVGISIALVGLFACFRVNEKGDNEHFLARFFCLSLPISIRLFAVTMAIFFIEFVALHVYQIPDTFVTQLNTLMGSGLDIAFFVWIRAKLLYIVRG